MRKSEALPSKYLTGPWVGSRKFTVTVAHVVQEVMENGRETKPVMYFVGKEKGMVVNSGNWDAMAIVWGDESDNWNGKTVELFALPTQTPAGQATLGCRIRAIVDPTPQTPVREQVASDWGAQPTPTSVQPVSSQPAGPGEQAAAQAKAGLQQLPTEASDLDEDVLSDIIPF